MLKLPLYFIRAVRISHSPLLHPLQCCLPPWSLLQLVYGRVYAQMRDVQRLSVIGPIAASNFQFTVPRSVASILHSGSLRQYTPGRTAVRFSSSRQAVLRYGQ